jgi:hypothetical protein
MQNDKVLQVWFYFTLLVTCAKTYSSTLFFVMYLQYFFVYIKFIIFFIKKAALTNFARYRILVLSMSLSMSMLGLQFSLVKWYGNNTVYLFYIFPSG